MFNRLFSKYNDIISIKTQMYAVPTYAHDPLYV